MNEVVPPLTPQNRKFPIEEGAMYNVEIKETIRSLNQVLATQVP